MYIHSIYINELCHYKKHPIETHKMLSSPPFMKTIANTTKDIPCSDTNIWHNLNSAVPHEFIPKKTLKMVTKKIK